MNNSAQDLAKLFQPETLAYLLQLHPAAFNIVLCDAGKKGEFDLLEMALPVVGRNHLNVNGNMLVGELVYTDANQEQHALLNETMASSFIRGLAHRPFTVREDCYVDALVEKLSITIPTSELKKFYALSGIDPGDDVDDRLSNERGFVLVNALSMRAAPELVTALIDNDANFLTLMPSLIIVDERRCEASGLSMAILCNDGVAFDHMLGKLTGKNHSPSVTFKALMEDSSLLFDQRHYPSQVKTVFEVIGTFCNSDTVDQFLVALNKNKLLTTNAIDAILGSHMLATRSSVFNFNDNDQCLLGTKRWDNRVVEYLLSYRDPAAPFTSKLLEIALRTACHPVLQRASSQNTFNTIMLEINDIFKSTTTILLISNKSPPDRIARCLEIMKANNLLDIDQFAKNGLAPLLVAAKTGNMPLLSALVDAGADTKLKDDRGWTAMSHLTGAERKDQFKQMIASKKAKEIMMNVLIEGAKLRQGL